MAISRANSAVSVESVRPFTFECYGVSIRISSNVQEMIDEGESVTRVSLLGLVRVIRRSNVDLHFELNRKGRRLTLIQNGENIASATSRRKFFKFFDSVIRASVGENASEHVFVHAGVVGWNGRAIVFPANSFKGKSTLAAELVRRGAIYYSDDFAILDELGLVHAFPRPLSMRTEEYDEYELTVDSLGGVQATEPLPVGMVLFTEYRKGAKWDPVVLTAGKGALEMIPYALTFRLNPQLSMRVLNKVTTNAIIASSPRGNAPDFADAILNFVDKSVN
jgi:hypothetical protein